MSNILSWDQVALITDFILFCSTKTHSEFIVRVNRVLADGKCNIHVKIRVIITFDYASHFVYIA